MHTCLHTHSRAHPCYNVEVVYFNSFSDLPKQLAGFSHTDSSCSGQVDLSVENMVFEYLKAGGLGIGSCRLARFLTESKDSCFSFDVLNHRESWVIDRNA